MESTKFTDREIARFVSRRNLDVRALLRNFRKLPRGQQRNFGPEALFFVSVLEKELERQRDLAVLKRRKEARQAKRGRS